MEGTEDLADFAFKNGLFLSNLLGNDTILQSLESA